MYGDEGKKSDRDEIKDIVKKKKKKSRGNPNPVFLCFSIDPL